MNHAHRVKITASEPSVVLLSVCVAISTTRVS
eukprot:COSAG05_NODE_4413_length_1526_cov_1.395936_1_plen_31_part_10